MTDFNKSLAALIPKQETQVPIAIKKKVRPQPRPVPLYKKLLPYIFGFYMTMVQVTAIALLSKGMFFTKPLYFCIVKALLWPLTIWSI